MIAYASRTGTRRNLDALRAAGWRLMVSAKGVHRHEGFPYAIDNGAYTAWTQDRPFDSAAFERLVESHGAGADFVVVPDLVAQGIRSFEFSLGWVERLRGVAPLYLAVQDGMTPELIEGGAGLFDGLFVGGTTEWKIDSLPMWAEFSRQWAVPLHVGRVNTRRRIRMCHDAGAASFDGSAASRYAVELPKLEDERQQPSLPFAFRMRSRGGGRPLRRLA